MQIEYHKWFSPSLGQDNIEKGFKSTLWGFVAIVAFMCVYYTLFGLF